MKVKIEIDEMRQIEAEIDDELIAVSGKDNFAKAEFIAKELECYIMAALERIAPTVVELPAWALGAPRLLRNLGLNGVSRRPHEK